MTDEIQAYLEDDIELVRHGDYNETLTFYEDDGVTPKNITNWSLTMWITKATNGKELDTLTTDGTRIIKTIASGQFNLRFTKAEVDAYDWTTADYRIGIDYGDGNNQIWRKGRVKVV